MKDRKLVVSFPGLRGCEIPLLYFTAKHYEDRGYEKRFISWPPGETDPDALLACALRQISQLDLRVYKSVIFVGKSIGTVIACRVKERLRAAITLILFTPLPETLPYLYGGNDILFIAAGDKDRYLDAEILRKLCGREGIECHIEPAVGHRMEVPGNLKHNLEIVYRVVSRIGGNI